MSTSEKRPDANRSTEVLDDEALDGVTGGLGPTRSQGFHVPTAPQRSSTTPHSSPLPTSPKTTFTS